MGEHAKTRYIVRHTEIALKKDASCMVEKDMVCEHVTIVKIFKSKERAANFIKEWYDKCPEIGYTVPGGRINNKQRVGETYAKIEYVLYGTSQVCESYSIEEIAYDDRDI